MKQSFQELLEQRGIFFEKKQKALREIPTQVPSYIVNVKQSEQQVNEEAQTEVSAEADIPPQPTKIESKSILSSTQKIKQESPLTRGKFKRVVRTMTREEVHQAYQQMREERWG